MQKQLEDAHCYDGESAFTLTTAALDRVTLTPLPPSSSATEGALFR